MANKNKKPDVICNDSLDYAETVAIQTETNPMYVWAIYGRNQEVPKLGSDMLIIPAEQARRIFNIREGNLEDCISIDKKTILKQEGWEFLTNIRGVIFDSEKGDLVYYEDYNERNFKGDLLNSISKPRNELFKKLRKEVSEKGRITKQDSVELRNELLKSGKFYDVYVTPAVDAGGEPVSWLNSVYVKRKPK